jgi:excisionase family DNA binding protein
MTAVVGASVQHRENTNMKGSTMTTTHTTEALLVTVKRAAQLLGISSWDAYKLCDSGELKSGLVGKRRLISTESLRKFAESVAA